MTLKKFELKKKKVQAINSLLDVNMKGGDLLRSV